MIQAILKFRAMTHTLFGGFEHLCCLGYALHEFKIEVGKTLIIFGSVGVVIFAAVVCLDLMMKHWPLWQRCIAKFKSIQYRKLL